jgi:hypothetical protein
MKNKIRVWVNPIIMMVLILILVSNCKKNEEDGFDQILNNSVLGEISSSNAVFNVDFSTVAGASNASRGICWGTNQDPTISDSIKVDSLYAATFSGKIEGLIPGTKYYLRIFVKTENTINYGNNISFVTLSSNIPVLKTENVEFINNSTVVTGGHILSSGNSPIKARGVCWSKNPDPGLNDHFTIDSLYTDSLYSESTFSAHFKSILYYLEPNTKYYVRAYATNDEGTGFGEIIAFSTTSSAIPVLTSTAISSISNSSAIGGGTIISSEGSEVQRCGVCWSTRDKPTIEDYFTSDSILSGSFASYMNGLSPKTKYYVRAYAINEAGVGYGNTLSFTTLDAQLPIVSTLAVVEITNNSAVFGARVSSEGSSEIKACGFLWGISNDSIAADSLSIYKFSSKSFNNHIGGLKPNTSYYVKAYATNNEGTGYGNTVLFTTKE